jgi:hypothetical protein
VATTFTNCRYIAGDQLAIADIPAMIAVDFGRVSNIAIKQSRKISHDGTRMSPLVPAQSMTETTDVSRTSGIALVLAAVLVLAWSVECRRVRRTFGEGGSLSTALGIHDVTSSDMLGFRMMIGESVIDVNFAPGALETPLAAVHQPLDVEARCRHARDVRGIPRQMYPFRALIETTDSKREHRRDPHSFPALLPGIMSTSASFRKAVSRCPSRTSGVVPCAAS